MKLPKIKLNLNKLLIIMGSIALILFIFFWFWWTEKEILINKHGDTETITGVFPSSGITGIQCENAKIRPIGVMYSGDAVTRPLSGISSADIVFEMPVTPGGVTRMMALFQCSDPGEIGSVRSAREDFIPLASGFGAIYVHWGGEREALKRLNDHVIDNVDAMKYEEKYFYRKQGVRQPHNGFTDMDKVAKAIKDLKYSTINIFEGYPHKDTKHGPNIINIFDTVSIDYPFPFDVKWIYNRDENNYERQRAGEPEIDRNNNEQVEASVVAIVKAESSFTNKDYLTVNTQGAGELQVYQNGTKISGQWKKDQAKLYSKMFFYDSEGKEIEFIPGKIWVEIIAQ